MKCSNRKCLNNILYCKLDDFDNMDIDYVAAFAKKNGYGFPVTELFSGFDFFGRASSISYVYSGAFVKFLLEKIGSEKLKMIYGNLDFENVYGKDLSSLFSPLILLEL